MRNLKRRVSKIEKGMGPEKGEWLRFPCPDGSFIEAPGCRTVIDVVARAMNEKARRKREETMDETEPK